MRPPSSFRSTMAKNKRLNTTTYLEMQDGTTVKLTLTYRYLLKLSAFNRRAYDDYNAVWNKKEGRREEIDNVRVIYAAYLCAALQDGTEDQAMSWDEFVDNMTPDREALSEALVGLLAPKRKGDTGRRSE